MVCFLLSALFYALSTVAYLAHWLSNSRRGRRLARPFLVVAVVLHGLAIALRWIEAGYAPLSNGFEAFSFYAWALSAAYLLVRPLRRYPALGVWVTPLALSSILVASVLPMRIEPLVPVLQSYWLPVHVTVSFIAYVLFSLAFAVGVAYLLQERALKSASRRTRTRQLPALEALDSLARSLALVGLAFMTGSLFSGSLWAEQAWGVVWVWEPQQVAALVTWALYVVYFYVRHQADWRDGRAAWLLVVGFISVLITFVGADLAMPGSRHDFLFGP
jgi:cytochrome c-type biogenesis protein CcsB